MNPAQNEITNSAQMRQTVTRDSVFRYAVISAPEPASTADGIPKNEYSEGDAQRYCDDGDYFEPAHFLALSL